MRQDQAENDPNSADSVRSPMLYYPPRFRLGEVYLVDEFRQNCNLAEKTISHWEREGDLVIYRPKTKAGFVLTDEVLACWRRLTQSK